MSLRAVVEEFDVQRFQSLPHFRDAKVALAETEGTLGKLGATICRHGLYEHIGLCLLHQHFPISQNERMVRKFTGDGAHIQPAEYSRKNPETTILPYMWRVIVAGGHASYYPLEFCEYAPGEQADRAHAEVDLITHATELLGELAAQLGEFDLLDTYGIATRSAVDAFSLPEEYTLLETTDAANRDLALRPVLVQELTQNADTTKTQWFFAPYKLTDSAVACEAHCWGHCISHCYSHN